MIFAVSCPRCGCELRPVGGLRTGTSARTGQGSADRDTTGSAYPAWQCDRCGVVEPLRVEPNASFETVDALCSCVRSANAADGTMSLFCPSPLPEGWAVTGLAMVGDRRTAVRATGVALAGPAPFTAGTADAVVVAEDPGVGLGSGLAGLAGPDPGPELAQALRATGAHAKVRIDGHPCPLWAVGSTADQSVYVGEARGRWLWVLMWPASAGYLLAEEIMLHDLVESVPSELVFGAATRRLLPVPASAGR